MSSIVGVGSGQSSLQSHIHTRYLSLSIDRASINSCHDHTRPPPTTRAPQVHPERLQEVDLGSILRKYKGKEVRVEHLLACVDAPSQTWLAFVSFIDDSSCFKPAPHTPPLPNHRACSLAILRRATAASSSAPEPVGGAGCCRICPRMAAALLKQSASEIVPSRDACIGRTADVKAYQSAARPIRAWKGHEGRVCVCSGGKGGGQGVRRGWSTIQSCLVRACLCTSGSTHRESERKKGCRPEKLVLHFPFCWDFWGGVVLYKLI